MILAPDGARYIADLRCAIRMKVKGKDLRYQSRVGSSRKSPGVMGSTGGG